MYKVLLILILAFASVSGMPVSILPFDYTVARTTLRLWHDLYIEKKLSHEFESIFAPTPASDESVFLAAVVNDEIKAFAQCNIVQDRYMLRCIAHAPHHEELGDSLVQFLVQEKAGVETSLRTKQPKWFVAYSYYIQSFEGVAPQDAL